MAMLPSATPSGRSGLRERIMALTRRERLFVAAAALALALFAAYLLWPSEDASGVELSQSPPPATLPPLMPAPIAPAAIPAAPPAPTVDTTAVAGLVLRGVMGGGPSGGAAIVGGADGSQRVVRVGRELAPGLVLREVGVAHAIASSPGGDVRLELNKAGGTLTAAASPTPAAPAPSAAASAGSAAARRETNELRLGLQPMKSKGRASGYAIKAGAIPPRLQRAGLRPGDVILRVNGSELDEERLMDLSWEMSNAEHTEFEIMRNGQRMKTSLPSAN